MKVAIIHDWLLGMRGGERCLEEFCSLFPSADIYTVFYEAENISPIINKHIIQTSVLQDIPGARKIHRYLLPLYPIAAKSLSKRISVGHKLVGYDLVISISHCVAKNVVVPPNTLHICYCLTPMRYIWDKYDSYFSNHPLEPIIRNVAKRLQHWDVAGTNNVDCFVAISDFVKERIKRVYNREAEVIYPPVRDNWIKPRKEEEKGNGFLCANALVPYKNVHLVVEAFNKLELPLTVVGKGPEERKLKQLARSNIQFKTDLSDAELAELYRTSRALVFAGEEDFGMIPVEMQCAGRPAICYQKGGALETINTTLGQESGLFFPELTSDSICAAVARFQEKEVRFTLDNCRINGRKFSTELFKASFASLLSNFDLLLDSTEQRKRKVA